MAIYPPTFERHDQHRTFAKYSGYFFANSRKVTPIWRRIQKLGPYDVFRMGTQLDLAALESRTSEVLVLSLDDGQAAAAPAAAEVMRQLTVTCSNS